MSDPLAQQFSPLRRWRRFHKLSQEGAARLARVSLQVWQRRERGRAIRASNSERIRALLMREWGRGEASARARERRDG